MRQNYWLVFAKAILKNWNKLALTDYYLLEDGFTQDTSRGEKFTYCEMCCEIFRLHSLFRDLGLKRGDHVAVCGNNSAHWIIAYLSVVSYQGIVVTVLPTQSIDDIAHQLSFSDTKALFATPDLWKELKKQSLSKIKHVLSLNDWSVMYSVAAQCANIHVAAIKRSQSIISLLPKLLQLYFSFSRKKTDELSVICFTSGSTGEAKGVMVAHRVYPVGGALLQSRLPAPKDNRNVMAYLPFGHVFGLVDVNSALYSGSHVFILNSSFINPSSLIKVMMQIRPYRIMLIPMIVDGFIAKRNEGVLKKCVDFLRYGIAGGALISPQTIEKLLEWKFPLTIGYGQTEASPLISISSPWKYKNGSCGQVIGGCNVHIAHNGEILVKGENVMLGYYKDPEATARKIDKDGWLHTGDKGHLDEDGYLYVEGRLEQDIIVLPNGENIHPEDIERKINALPEVKESIVLARDGKLVAIVVPQITNDQSPMTNTDLRRIILRNVNPSLPLFSQLYDVEITDVPLQKTEKQTLKRYLYK